MFTDKHRNTLISSYCSFRYECQGRYTVSNFLEHWFASCCCFLHWQCSTDSSLVFSRADLKGIFFKRFTTFLYMILPSRITSTFDMHLYFYHDKDQGNNSLFVYTAKFQVNFLFTFTTKVSDSWRILTFD